ncbi:MAG: methylenetetrahydrofolate reductase C-terminal domain-containing protein [Armatimonadota bacterium]|nr:methylenetetrahydrofolate reductase C-terminal domain-containing protein [Armatimonadota bacterium]
MIVAHRKNIQDLKSALAEYKKILVLGCGTCMTVCLAGGEREVGMISSALRIAYRVDGQEHELIEATIERQCENQFMEDILPLVQEADAILSLGCGAGVQAMAERYPNKPIYPGVDTKFIGILQEQGIWTEKCAACGKCIIGAYGTVCPITRCSKQLTEGPCGGARDGKCEVSPEIECGWQLIYNRLKALGQLDLLLEPAPLTDWSKSHEGGCRKIVREDQRIRNPAGG